MLLVSLLYLLCQGKRSFPESDFLPQELLVTLSRRDSPEGRAQQGKSAVQGKSQLVSFHYQCCNTCQNTLHDLVDQNHCVVAFAPLQIGHHSATAIRDDFYKSRRFHISQCTIPCVYCCFMTAHSQDKSSLRPPANVWGHPKRRTKYKHLVDNAPCICGAGK